jgi:hypothetical protein
MSVMRRWPDYLRRDTLAARLDVAPGYVDQLRKRGLLPEPIRLGEAELYRWADIEQVLQSGSVHADVRADDPYLDALNAPSAEASTARAPRRSQGQTLRLLPTGPIDGAGGKADQAAG